MHYHQYLLLQIALEQNNFLIRVREWKEGLTKIIGEKVLLELGLCNETTLGKLANKGIKLINYLCESISAVKDSLNLQKTQELSISNFLKNNKIVVYLDDLDRGWEGKQEDIVRISALLNAIRDISSENPGLMFKVALRLDVY